MRTILAAIVFAAALHSVPALAADAIAGTWVLDVAKSTYKPGPAPNRFTRTYTVTADGLALKWDGFDSVGKPTSGFRIYKLDGKPHPVADAPDYDSVSSRRIDARTIETIEQQAGKPSAKMVLAVSEDGKVLTLTKRGIDAHGVAFDIIAIYERKQGGG